MNNKVKPVDTQVDSIIAKKRKKVEMSKYYISVITIIATVGAASWDMTPVYNLFLSYSSIYTEVLEKKFTVVIVVILLNITPIIVSVLYLCMKELRRKGLLISVCAVLLVMLIVSQSIISFGRYEIAIEELKSEASTYSTSSQKSALNALSNSSDISETETIIEEVDIGLVTKLVKMFECASTLWSTLISSAVCLAATSMFRKRKYISIKNEIDSLQSYVNFLQLHKIATDDLDDDLTLCLDAKASELESIGHTLLNVSIDVYFTRYNIPSSRIENVRTEKLIDLSFLHKNVEAGKTI